MKDVKAYVYILVNDRGNVLYVGCTKDLKNRMGFHKKRLLPGFTKKYNVHRLVYFEEYSCLKLAVEQEKYLKKRTRKKKNELIQSMNSAYDDLTDQL